MTNDAPLKVLAGIAAEAIPVIDALKRLHRDVGSVAADKVLKVDPPLDEPMRLICVACVDRDDVTKLANDLRAELGGDAHSSALASKVAVIEVGDGMFVIVFTELHCIAVDDIITEGEA